jgi:hypothetical protein
MLRRFDFTEQLWVSKAGGDVHSCRAVIRLRDASLELLGPPCGEDRPPFTAGMTPARGWKLVAECGLEFVVTHFFDTEDDFAAIYAGSLDELDHALLHLPFGAKVLGREGAELTGGWGVRRVDASGNSFSVGRYPREESARCVAKLFEDRGHKQTYFVDVLGPPPAQPRREWLVMRMDDNGQIFPVRAHLFRGQALEHMKLLEEEPRHKQTYWVRRIDSAREALPDARPAS